MKKKIGETFRHYFIDCFAWPIIDFLCLRPPIRTMVVELMAAKMRREQDRRVEILEDIVKLSDQEKEQINRTGEAHKKRLLETQEEMLQDNKTLTEKVQDLQWLSARDMLTIAGERVAKEKLATLVGKQSEIIEWLSDKNDRHILFARMIYILGHKDECTPDQIKTSYDAMLYRWDKERVVDALIKMTTFSERTRKELPGISSFDIDAMPVPSIKPPDHDKDNSIGESIRKKAEDENKE